MKDLLLKTTNPLEFELDVFDLQFTTNDTEFLSQKLRIVLSFFKDEWYLNKNEGIPYYQDILVKNPDINLISDIYKDAILSVDEVDEILVFELTIESGTRELSLDFTVKSTEGNIVEVTL